MTTPDTCDLLITGGRLLALDTDAGSLDDHAIAIAGSTIADVGPTSDLVARWTATRTIAVGGATVSPGFVDAHVHFSGYLATASAYEKATGPGLFSGGDDVVRIVPFVAEMTAMELPADLTAAVLRPVFAAMIRCGITSVVDAGSAGHDGLVAAADQLGIRAAIGPSLADRWHDENGVLGPRADHRALLDRTRAWVEANDGAAGGRVRALISAVETIACSDELLAGIAELAGELDLPTNIHSHITAASDEAHVQAYGRTATRRLADAGLLEPRLTAMHVGNAGPDDIAAFVDAGITVNHNPLGNAMLGFGTTGGAIPAMIEAGVPVALGSDYAGAMVATPFDSMRAALAANRDAVRADDGLLLEQALAMATNPGVSVGRPGLVGRLAAGQLADIVVVDTSGPHHLGDRHPVPSLALRARPDDVRTVIIDGRVVLDDGRLTTIDEAHVLSEARAALGLSA